MPESSAASPSLHSPTARSQRRRPSRSRRRSEREYVSSGLANRRAHCDSVCDRAHQRFFMLPALQAAQQHWGASNQPRNSRARSRDRLPDGYATKLQDGSIMGGGSHPNGHRRRGRREAARGDSRDSHGRCECREDTPTDRYEPTMTIRSDKGPGRNPLDPSRSPLARQVTAVS